ncbi:MAG: hypothetical protein L3J59_11230 [Methylococcaceae bacterium]|nr:hypothetical protein [Methylococcaceae bacterium]
MLVAPSDAQGLADAFDPELRKRNIDKYNLEKNADLLADIFRQNLPQ